jgi:hypothetical protein
MILLRILGKKNTNFQSTLFVATGALRDFRPSNGKVPCTNGTSGQPLSRPTQHPFSPFSVLGLPSPLRSPPHHPNGLLVPEVGSQRALMSAKSSTIIRKRWEVPRLRVKAPSKATYRSMIRWRSATSCRRCPSRSSSRVQITRPTMGVSMSELPAKSRNSA